MSTRYLKIDEIRGLTLISMILYHFMWDLNNIAGYEMDWYAKLPGEIWQKSICITFIFISGFCFSMGKNRVKRSCIVFLAGALVTAITLIATPENRIVLGVLTFIGAAGLVAIPLDKLHRKLETYVNKETLNQTLIIGNILLFVAMFNINYGSIYVIFDTIAVPKYLYRGNIATVLGFTDPFFFSTDYFSVFPWIFNYLAGYYFYRYIFECRENKFTLMIKSLLLKDRFKKISYIGKNTLVIYLLHQPVLYLITLVIQSLSH